MKSSRDKNEGTYRNGYGGEGSATPDLSCYWEGARENSARIINVININKKFRQRYQVRSCDMI